MDIATSIGYLRSLRKFVRNNKENASKTKKALQNFKENPSHPSLNIEKLGGTDLWTIRLDKGNRIFFTKEDSKTIMLINIGKHDKYRKY
ncbi:MAG: plasmid stabilization protein [bacterium]|nr:plasmid stabilization protein [bacterium]